MLIRKGGFQTRPVLFKMRIAAPPCMGWQTMR